MTETFIIENPARGLLVFNDGLVGSDVFLTHQPARLELSPPPAPPKTFATIRGKNGLYINVKPPGPPVGGQLVWSHEPYEWEFDDKNRISTIIHGEILHWFVRDGEDVIILNPYASSPFVVRKY